MGWSNYIKAKRVWNSPFLSCWAENCFSSLCTNPLFSPILPGPKGQIKRKPHKEGVKYDSQVTLIILSNQNIKRISFGIFEF